MQLYIVSDRTWLHGRTLTEVLEQTLQGGATFLQLREKELDNDTFLKEANAIKKLAKQYNVPFVINDDIEIAMACDADGAHIGQQDGSVADAGRILGNDKILGVSVQTVAQARLAQADGADYLGVGSMFTTTTKHDADAVDMETLNAICDAVTLPVVAIGGIHHGNIEQLKATGCHGVAVISAVLASDNIKSACHRLLEVTKDF